MRIISGIYGGRTLKIPRGLPARPTTDRAKEALFNILNQQIGWEETDVLDLFSGTGNISLECISRGARSVTAIEKDGRSVAAVKNIIRQWEINGLKVQRMDVKSVFGRLEPPFGFIFLDPPYQWGGVGNLVERLLVEQWLTPGGLLVAEHMTSKSMKEVIGWQETRAYGDSSFSFFRHTNGGELGKSM